jgi:hypothetical protein
MYIAELIIESTRKCNLRCAHCLRGNPQRVTMTPRILHNVLQNVSGIGTVTFTGGEPSLAPEVIEEFNNLCIWRKISVGSFYIVHNGKAHNGISRFMKAVERLYYLADEQGSCALAVSQDQYHKALRDVAWHRYYIRDEYTGESYEEFPPYFSRDSRDHSIDNILNEGRAKENQMGWEEPRTQTPWTVEEYQGEMYVQDHSGQVYIAANGNVASDCNMSFSRVDRESKGNVLTKSLTEIIDGYCIREPQEQEAVI